MNLEQRFLSEILGLQNRIRNRRTRTRHLAQQAVQ